MNCLEFEWQNLLQSIVKLFTKDTKQFRWAALQQIRDSAKVIERRKKKPTLTVLAELDVME